MSHGLADKIEMQHRLFAELSTMFGKEVPLYDKSLLVNHECNRVVCDLLAHLFRGFSVSEEQLGKTSGERHGAIRIGRADEYRWVGRFFACFAMEPHNFYDMTSVGAKSQPVIATAFRSAVNPEHRVFTSLLRTDYFDALTKDRIDALLGQRQVFTDRAKALIELSERQGGLSWDDARALIREGVERIFRWTGQARDVGLYQHLCESGFKIAADIACFQAHHLNHLTPNTFWIDLYTAAMKFCMGEIDESAFRLRAHTSLARLSQHADRDFLRLSFRHLSREQIDAFEAAQPSPGVIEGMVHRLVVRLGEPDAKLTDLKHSGFKDTTEGPPVGLPVLLRQDAYKALTEPVHFTNPDGSETDIFHTARFGEIEQRFYATTPGGRALYDRCLASAEQSNCTALIKSDFVAYEAEYASHFAAFPRTLPGLLEADLVYAVYEPTPVGLAANPDDLHTTDIHELVRLGYVAREGIRHEDFLPVSAAGIFASNLSQYGTQSTAAVKPTYTQEMLEEILGRPIVNADDAHRGMQACSLLNTYDALGLLGRIDPALRARLEQEAFSCPAQARQAFTRQSPLAARV